MDQSKLIGLGDSEQRFLDEWQNSSDYIVAHTSGSTGTPKEIRLLKSDMLQSARSTNARFGITDRSRLLCPLSINYIAGKMMVVRALEAGCTLIMEHPSNAPFLLDYGDIDLMAVVPSQCAMLMNNPLARQRVKNLIVGGASIAPDLERALTAMPWHSYATYGMTETCSHVALRNCGCTLYEAMPGITFATDGRDCLIINAPQFSFKHLTTNDIVTLHNSTRFEWMGRFDNVVNSGGIKLFPEQIEKKLEGRLPMPFYLHSLPDAKWGEALTITLLAPGCEQNCASATLPDGTTISNDDVLTICRKALSAYEVPKHVRFVDHFNYTATGKLKRT